MLSFNDYIWESRMANLRRQIAIDLVKSGQTLEEVVKEIISEKQVQNELFGGFVQRLGAAWRALWHGPEEPAEAQQPKYKEEDVENLLQLYHSQQAEIQKLIAQLHKGGSGNSEIEKALYEIMKKAGKQHYELMKQMDQQERDTGKFKKGGIMDATYQILDNLRDLSQNPDIAPQDRFTQLEKAEQTLDAQLKKAEELFKNPATDPVDKNEAKMAVDLLTNQQVKDIRASVDKMKENLKAHLGGATKALSGGGTEDYHAVRHGSGGASIPPNASPKEAIAAIASMNGADKARALEAWYNGLSDAAKSDLNTKISGKPDWNPTGKIGQMLLGAFNRPEINAKL